MRLPLLFGRAADPLRPRTVVQGSAPSDLRWRWLSSEPRRELLTRRVGARLFQLRTYRDVSWIFICGFVTERSLFFFFDGGAKICYPLFEILHGAIAGWYLARSSSRFNSMADRLPFNC